MNFFKKLLLIITLLIIGNHSIAQSEEVPQAINKKAFTIGETVEIHSDILNENRVLNIYLPLGYSPDSTHRYPVIYLLDGSAHEDFIHIAGLVQFGSFSWINLLPESIVVGISNVDRRRDYTYPTTVKEHKEDFPTTGESEKFISFIENELQPFIDASYKTDSLKTLIGQSLGGLLATEILYTNPDLFDNYIIVSPSLWWDAKSLLEWEPKAYTSTKQIYVCVGKEGKVMEKVAKQLFAKLKKVNNENTTLHFAYFKKQNHGDVLHLAAYNAFEKIFKREEKPK